MKYLIFALCVCAASAATVPDNGSYKPQRQVKTPVVAEVAPVVTVAPVAPVESVAPVEPVQPVPIVRSNLPAQFFKPVPPVAKSVTVYNEHYPQIIRSDSEVRPDGYQYAYETENGIVAGASGDLKTVGDHAVLVSQGSFRYISPEGTPVEVTYIADENGFHPQSDSLPVGPEIPQHVLRSLEYIEAHRPREIVKTL